MAEERGNGSEPREPSGTPSRVHEAGSNGVLRTAPALARFAAAAYWRSARWTLATSARATSRLMRAASAGQTPAEIFRSTRTEVRQRARQFLGVGDEEEDGGEIEMTPEAIAAEHARARKSLRERGAELLRRSADVNFEEDSHPAYARILEDLAPDEGRILRLLVQQGPQPSVDVRAGWIPLKATTELLAPGLSMIGSEAGCRHLADVPAYLNNLFRLGLIWFSSEPVSDPLRYQVLEAQPAVTEVMAEAGRARTVRRSIELTPFGKDFCELCLPEDTAEFEALASPKPSSGDAGEPGVGEDREGTG
jgi:hypothetical protein